MKCKFCGKEVVSEKYINREKQEASCPDCGKYCMTKCDKASSVKGWYYEPCLSCSYNPYRQGHRLEDGKWIAIKNV